MLQIISKKEMARCFKETKALKEVENTTATIAAEGMSKISVQCNDIEAMPSKEKEQEVLRRLF